jgi:hypothetical protein
VPPSSISSVNHLFYGTVTAGKSLMPAELFSFLSKGLPR